jgi:UDP-glucose 4-epimerase
MKVLVTGGAGFIGHHVVRALLDRGDDVSIIDDLSSGTAARLAGLEHRVQFTHGSILDNAALDAAADGCQSVVHLAAIASVARSLEAPARSNEVNVGGTIEVMVAAARQGARRVVLAGSSAVYGNPEVLPCRESMRAEPESPYGASKLAAEHYLHTLGRLHGIGSVALRFFNVFGPGQDPASEYAAVVPRFITAVLEARQPVVNGRGDFSRDFTYVDNVVQAVLLALRPDGPVSLTCNVASGMRYSLLELLDAISQAAGRTADPVFGPERPGDIRDSQADISMARTMLGYEVGVGFEEGLARTVAWYRDQSVSVP